MNMKWIAFQDNGLQYHETEIPVPSTFRSKMENTMYNFFMTNKVFISLYAQLERFTKVINIRYINVQIKDGNTISDL